MSKKFTDDELCTLQWAVENYIEQLEPHENVDRRNNELLKELRPLLIKIEKESDGKNKK